MVENLVIIYSIIITSVVILGSFVIFRLFERFSNLCRTVVKEQRLLAEKAFIQLKAQSVEQAVAATELEKRYKLERDAAVDALRKEHDAPVASEIQTFAEAVSYRDVEGNEYTIDDLDIGYR